MAGVSEEQIGQRNYEQNKTVLFLFFQDSLKRESQKQIEHNIKYPVHTLAPLRGEVIRIRYILNIFLCDPGGSSSIPWNLLEICKFLTSIPDLMNWSWVFCF